jgi:hypothetical protein
VHWENSRSLRNVAKEWVVVENNFLQGDIYLLDRKIKAAKAKGEDTAPIFEEERKRQAEFRAKQIEASCKAKPDDCGWVNRDIVNGGVNDILNNGAFWTVDSDVIDFVQRETEKDNAVINANISEAGKKKEIWANVVPMMVSGKTSVSVKGKGTAKVETGTKSVNPLITQQVNADKNTKAEAKGKNTSGADNVATYPKLKEGLNTQNLDNIAKQDPRLEAAIKGSGTRNPNFSVGAGTQKEADRLGKIWVGDGAKLTTDGKGWVSADGTRVYRFPKEKPNTPAEFTNTGIQANFEILKDGKRVSNGHMDVTK